MKFLTRFKPNSKPVGLAKPRGKFRTRFGRMAVLLGALMVTALAGGCKESCIKKNRANFQETVDPKCLARLNGKPEKKPAKEELPGGMEESAKKKGSGGFITRGVWTPDGARHYRRGVLPGESKKKPAKKKLKKSKGILIPPKPGRQGFESSF